MSDPNDMLNGMLDLFEATVRTIEAAGGEAAMVARFERMLPREPAAPAFDLGAWPLDEIAMTRILGCLKAARGHRLTREQLQANETARADVMRVLRHLASIRDQQQRAA